MEEEQVRDSWEPDKIGRAESKLLQEVDRS